MSDLIKPIAQRDLNEMRENLSGLVEHFKSKRIFITGGTGFFGKWITQVFVHLNREIGLGCELTVLCRNSKRVLTDQPWLNDKGVKLLQGDVRTFDLVDENFDFFLHAATSASASLNDSSPAEMTDIIVEGTKRVLAQAEKSRAPRFLFVSSGAVYGTQDPSISHMPETSKSGPDITNVSNAYAEGKRMAELYCQFAQKNGKISLSIARCFAFLGPYLPLDQHFAAGNFVKDFLEGKTITMNGDGTAVRSYMYPTDLVEWLLTIMVRGEAGEAYNVGSDHAVNLKSLAELIDGGKNGVNVRGILRGTASQSIYVPSIEKAKSRLGLRLRVDLAQTIARTVSWGGGCL